MRFYTAVFTDRRKKNRLIIAQNKQEAMEQAKKRFKCVFALSTCWFAYGGMTQ